jgi:predicted transcriptional regulator of viral defense system
MNRAETLHALLQENNGFLRTADVVRAGISKPTLASFVSAHALERVAHGLYMSPDAWDDGMYVLQTRYPEAVFSHESALYLLGMAEREPLPYAITLRKNKNSAALNKEGVRVYKIQNELFEKGLTRAVTPTGHEVRCYNAERTLCDVFRSRRNVEIQDLQVAVKGYLRSKEKDIPALLRMAKTFSVEKAIRPYLEALL